MKQERNGSYPIIEIDTNLIGVYVYDELIWTSYDTCEYYGNIGINREFDESVCKVMFARKWFMENGYE